MKKEKYDEIIRRAQAKVPSAMWILTIRTARHGGPELVIRERQPVDEDPERMHTYGRIGYGQLRACKLAIRQILAYVYDDLGRPMELPSLIDDRVEYRGDLPLDRAAGPAMALLVTLIDPRMDEARAELLAWRISRLTAEEAMYYLGKVTLATYGEAARTWAVRGMRTMLCGPGTKGEQAHVEETLERIRR